MGSTRPRCGSRIQIRQTLRPVRTIRSARQFNDVGPVPADGQHRRASPVKLVDYATLRGRAGYAWGQFLPYAAVGIAAGRFNYETTVTVTGPARPIPPPPGPSLRSYQHGEQLAKTNAICRRRRRGPWHRLGRHARNVFARRMGIRRFRAGQSEAAPTFNTGQIGAGRGSRGPSPAVSGSNSRLKCRHELTAAGKSPISASGTPLPNEGRLSGRIDK